MVKCKAVCWFVTFAVWICVATAQNSKPLSSSAKAGPDPVHSATKPLTPKSAMPPPHKSSVAPPPHASTNTQKANAELNHLERQPIKATGPKKTAKSVAPKPTATNANGSGINATYQKPAANKP